MAAPVSYRLWIMLKLFCVFITVAFPAGRKSAVRFWLNSGPVIERKCTMNYCATFPGICQNGGSCKDNGCGGYCVCSPEYTGHMCETSISDVTATTLSDSLIVTVANDSFRNFTDSELGAMPPVVSTPPMTNDTEMSQNETTQKQVLPVTTRKKFNLTADDQSNSKTPSVNTSIHVGIGELNLTAGPSIITTPHQVNIHQTTRSPASSNMTKNSSAFTSPSPASKDITSAPGTKTTNLTKATTVRSTQLPQVVIQMTTPDVHAETDAISSGSKHSPGDHVVELASPGQTLENSTKITTSIPVTLSPIISTPVTSFPVKSSPVMSSPFTASQVTATHNASDSTTALHAETVISTPRATTRDTQETHRTQNQSFGRLPTMAGGMSSPPSVYTPTLGTNSTPTPSPTPTPTPSPVTSHNVISDKSTTMTRGMQLKKLEILSPIITTSKDPPKTNNENITTGPDKASSLLASNVSVKTKIVASNTTTPSPENVLTKVSHFVTSNITTPSWEKSEMSTLNISTISAHIQSTEQERQNQTTDFPPMRETTNQNYSKETSFPNLTTQSEIANREITLPVPTPATTPQGGNRNRLRTIQSPAATTEPSMEEIVKTKSPKQQTSRSGHEQFTTESILKQTTQPEVSITTKQPTEKSTAPPTEKPTPRRKQQEKVKPTQPTLETKQAKANVTRNGSNKHIKRISKTTMKPKQQKSKETTMNARQHKSTEATTKQRQDKSTETTMNPKQQKSTKTTIKPKQKKSTGTTVKPKQQKSTETTMKARKQKSTETTTKPKQKKSTETTVKPKQQKFTETTMKAREQKSIETITKTRQQKSTKTTMKPKSSTKTPENPKKQQPMNRTGTNVSIGQTTASATTSILEKVSTNQTQIKRPKSGNQNITRVHHSTFSKSQTSSTHNPHVKTGTGSTARPPANPKPGHPDVTYSHDMVVDHLSNLTNENDSKTDIIFHTGRNFTDNKVGNIPTTESTKQSVEQQVKTPLNETNESALKTGPGPTQDSERETKTAHGTHALATHDLRTEDISTQTKTTSTNAEKSTSTNAEKSTTTNAEKSTTTKAEKSTTTNAEKSTTTKAEKSTTTNAEKEGNRPESKTRGQVRHSSTDASKTSTSTRPGRTEPVEGPSDPKEILEVTSSSPTLPDQRTTVSTIVQTTGEHTRVGARDDVPVVQKKKDGEKTNNDTGGVTVEGTDNGQMFPTPQTSDDNGGQSENRNNRHDNQNGEILNISQNNNGNNTKTENGNGNGNSERNADNPQFPDIFKLENGNDNSIESNGNGNSSNGDDNGKPANNPENGNGRDRGRNGLEILREIDNQNKLLDNGKMEMKIQNSILPQMLLHSRLSVGDGSVIGNNGNAALPSPVPTSDADNPLTGDSNEKLLGVQNVFTPKTTTFFFGNDDFTTRMTPPVGGMFPTRSKNELAPADTQFFSQIANELNSENGNGDNTNEHINQKWREGSEWSGM